MNLLNTETHALPFEAGIYPEFAAGLFSHRDCTVAFYSRIRALSKSTDVVLIFGAGRGANIVTDVSPFRRQLQSFRGTVNRSIGIDVDEAVLDNPDLDDAHHIRFDQSWPIDDNSVDIMVCDHVFEHLDDPDAFVSEALRVLKPGGWLCARTPTKWGYIGIATRLIPNRLHVRMLSKLQPQRKAEDVFPTRYRLNSFSCLRRRFPANVWRHCSYGYNGVPGYHANNRLLFRLIECWCWLMPSFLSAKLHIFLQKKA